MPKLIFAAPFYFYLFLLLLNIHVHSSLWIEQVQKESTCIEMVSK